jgi:O-antigen ligase
MLKEFDTKIFSLKAIKFFLGASGFISILSPKNVLIVFVICSLLGSLHLDIKKIFSFKKIKQSNFFYSLIIFLSWCFCSLIWSKVPYESFKLAFRILILLMLAWLWYHFLLQRSKQEIFSYVKILSITMFCAISFIFLDSLTGYKWHVFKKIGQTKAFIQASIIGCLSLWLSLIYINETIMGKKLKVFYSLLFLSLTILFVSPAECDSSLYGLILGVVYSLLTIYYPKFSVKTLFYVTLVSIFLFPLSFLLLSQKNIIDFNHLMFNGSYMHRIYIWKSNLEVITNNIWGFILGNGLDSSRYRYPITQPKAKIIEFAKGNYGFVDPCENIMHPHNIAIQIWYELGLIGLLLLSICIFYIFKKIIKQNKNIAFFTGYFVTVQFIFWFNLGCWQNWWVSILFLISPILIRVSQDFSKKINKF